MSQRRDVSPDRASAPPLMEEARRVAVDRLIELERWVGKARIHVTDASLYEVETDFEVIQQLAGISAEQILRVLRESGLLRDAAHRSEDQWPDEIREQRERDHHREA